MIGYYTPYLFVTKVANLERAIPLSEAVFLLSFIGKSMKRLILLRTAFPLSHALPEHRFQ